MSRPAQWAGRQHIIRNKSIKIQKLIDSPDKWTKLSIAEDAQRNSVDPLDKSAVRWSLYGGFRKAYDTKDDRYVAILRVYEAVKVLYPQYCNKYLSAETIICHFNDNMATTFDDIKKVLDYAVTELVKRPVS